MSGLARETGAVNLGQGFPEWDGPEDIRARAARAVMDGPNQYPPMRGDPELRAAVARHYNRTQGLDLDWRREVTITSGATEALAAALLAVLSPGDEVVIFEPAYDSYLPMLRRAGAQARIVRLTPPDWRIDPAALAAAFTPRTRAVILNTPLNPTASVATGEDLATIAKACIAHDCICISDEVWEECLFDGRRHLGMLAIEGMRERTIKVGSAGKMFSMTGWKVGFACAGSDLTEAFARAHQFLTFTTPPALQTAVAFGLETAEGRLEAMREDLQRRRDRLSLRLAEEGFVVLPAEGTYFLAVDLSASGIAASCRDFAFRAVREAGVATIPMSAFYVSPPASSLVRLCFAKTDATLEEGVRRLVRARDLWTGRSTGEAR
jgi:aspartate/methionine/tyrosine aminotransferase